MKINQNIVFENIDIWKNYLERCLINEFNWRVELKKCFG